MHSEKASHQTMKQLNREMILKTLRMEPSISRADLAKITQLSRPTVSSIVKKLVDEGLVKELGSGDSKGGRKPILLKYNATYQYVIGAILKNNRISLRLASLDGEAIDEVIFPIDLPNTIKVIFNTLKKGVHHFCELHQIEKSQLLGMVFGVPGISRSRTKNFLHSPSILYENEQEIEESMQNFYIPILVENDVNLMAMGEYSKLLLKNYNSLLYVFSGLGIGSGFIMDGALKRGAHQAAGEIGSMVIGNPENVLPNMGIFESNFGTLGVANRLGIDNPSEAVGYMVSHMELNKVSGFYKEYKVHWHAAILSIAAVIDPEIVLLGGDLNKLPSDFLTDLQIKSEKHLPVHPEFINAQDEEVGLRGAVELALESFSIYGYQKIKQKGEEL